VKGKLNFKGNDLKSVPEISYLFIHSMNIIGGWSEKTGFAERD
jgi:hypothetical protein